MKYIWIPVELCVYIIQNRLYTVLQIYLFLKLEYSGQGVINCEVIEKAAQALGISVRTVKNSLKTLIQLNFVGHNIANKYYYVRGFQRICEIIKVSPNLVAEFNGNDLPHFRAFVAGAAIGKLIAIQKWRKRQIESNIGGSVPVRSLSAIYFPVALQAISKCFGISLSSAFRLKKLALEYKFIDVRNTLIETAFFSKDIDGLRVAYPELSNRFVKRNGRIYLQEPDRIACNIFMKGKK